MGRRNTRNLFADIGKAQAENERLLSRIADLENKLGDALSKMKETVIDEKDGIQSEITELKIKLENVELEFENEKKRQYANSGFEMKRVRGWLWKRGVLGPTARIWRHRWFKAKSDGKLYYYKRKTIERGFIKIDKITEVKNLPSSEQNDENSCFNIVTPARTYEIKAKDKDEKLSWIKALDDLKYWQNRRDSAARPF